MHTLNKWIFKLYEKALVLYFGFMQLMWVMPQIGKYEYTYKYEEKKHPYNIILNLCFVFYVACVLDLQFFF